MVGIYLIDVAMATANKVLARDQATCSRYTLRRDNDAIAALFISFYPIFQTCQDDNTYHLQAFRHLWVIAAQPRSAVILYIVKLLQVIAKILIIL